MDQNYMPSTKENIDQLFNRLVTCQMLKTIYQMFFYRPFPTLPMFPLNFDHVLSC